MSATVFIEFNEQGASKVVDQANRVSAAVDGLKKKLREPLNPMEAAIKSATSQLTALRRMASLPIESTMFKNATGSQFGAIQQQVLAARKEMALFNAEVKKTGPAAKEAGFQLGFIGRLIAAMAVRKVVHDLVELTDTFTNFQNKLKTVTADEWALTVATEDLIKMANETKSPIDAVSTVFTRTSRAVSSLGKTQKEVTQFTQTLTKAIKIGGSTTAESTNAMIQLSQGLSSGALRGDELRSVLEQLPVVADLIAQKMGVTVGELRKLGAAGKLTTEDVFGAIIDATGSVDKQFAKLRPTFEQLFDVIKNKWLVAIGEASPLTNALSDALQGLVNNFDMAIRATTVFVAALSGLALTKGVIMPLFAAIAANPIAAAIIAATTALVIFADEIHTSADGLATLQDDAGSVFKSMLTDLKSIGSEIVKVTELFSEMHPRSKEDGGFDWGLLGAQAIDGIRMALSPEQSIGVLMGVADAAAYAHQTVDQMMADRAKNKVAQDTSDAMKELKDLKRWEVENRKPPKVDIKTATGKKGRKESGTTFEELIRIARLDKEENSQDNYLVRRIEDKLNDALEKLKPSIKAWGKNLNAQISAAEAEYKKATSRSDIGPETAEQFKKRSEIENKALGIMKAKVAAAKAQSAEYEKQKKLLEEEIRLGQTWTEVHKLIEVIQKETVKAQREELDRRNELLDKELEIEATKIRTLQKQKESAAGDWTKFRQDTAEGLDPGLKTNQKIADLERFKDSMSGSPEWIALANKEIETLHYSLSAGGRAFLTYGDQMRGTFGPGGTLSQGLADTLVRADNLKQGLKDLLTTISNQALSALLQLPINAALGGIGASLFPSAGGATGINAGGTATSNPFSSLGRDNGLAQRYAPFASGGYTGNYGTNEPAGIVHGQEYVVNAEATRKYRPMLEAINDGQSVGAKSAPPVNVSVHNYAGVQVETTQVSPGEIQVMINKAIQEKTPGLVASHIGNPNSPVARSLDRNLNAPRKRL